MTNKIIVKNSFEMPAVDETVELTVSESCNLAPECWIWNESVGYLKVNKFNLYDDKIIVENLGRRENAKKGTVFPSCMEFLITAPSALDPYNPLSTCLAADFNSPTVGNTALMSVGSTYVIKADDQIIVDGDYRYSVVQVINSTTLKVLNEGLGKEGIIEVGCDSCVPVQVVSKLNCCPIPSGDLTSNTTVLTVIDGADVLLDSASLTLDTDLSQYDNSVTKFIDVTGVPRGTLSSNSSLVSVTNGTNNVLDNISLDLDTDLSKYNNTTSGYITLGDVPRGTLSSNETLLTVTNGTNNVLDNISLDLDTDLSKYDNTSSNFLATSDKKNLTSNTTVLTVTNGTGTTLENTSLTLDTDLSQYDNSSSNFLATSDKKDLTSTSPILTVTNGTGATLENTTVSLNTDLSQYDNSVSQFVSAGGLASGDLTSNSTLLTVNNGTDSILTNVSLDLDDDLANYDNSNSQFVTSDILAGIVIDTSIPNFVSIDIDYAGITSHQALGGDLGANYPWDQIFTRRVASSMNDGSYISLPQDGLPLVINCGDGGTYGVNYNKLKLMVANQELLELDLSYGTYGSVTSYGDFLPDTTSQLDIGSTTQTWNNVYTDSITLNGTTYTSIPTVNDATLTIYNSDGVTPFVTFTANASNNVTATLPASGNTYTATSPISIDANNDISISQATTSTDGYLSSTDWNTFNNKASAMVYFEEALSGTVAIFQPKSGSATYFDLGAPGNGYTTAYTDNILSTNSKIQLENSAKLVLRNDTSVNFSTLSSNPTVMIDTASGSIYTTNSSAELGSETSPYRPFYSAKIRGLDPGLTSNSYVGSSTYPYTNGNMSNIYVESLYGSSSSSPIKLKSDLDADSNSRKSIGFNNYFAFIHGETIRAKTITPGAGNTTTIGFTGNGATNVILSRADSNTTGSIGTNSLKWNNLYVTNINGSPYSPCDERKKENIEERKSNSLDAISNLKIYSYNYKEDKDKTSHIGIMAQELQRLIPDCVVDRGETNTKGEHEEDLYIDVMGYIGVLTESIKELSAKVKDLESKLGDKDANNEVAQK